MWWLSLEFWRYLLEQPRSLRRFVCRARGHRCGPIFYRSYGLEPDMRCKNCHDFLG